MTRALLRMTRALLRMTRALLRMTRALLRMTRALLRMTKASAQNDIWNMFHTRYMIQRWRDIFKENW